MSEEQPTKETAKAYAAFVEYCALGPARSLSKLSESNQQYAKSIPLLKRWSSEHNWQERVKQYDAERAEEKRLKHDAEIEEMNQRHAEMGMTQQERALEQIKKLMAAKSFGSMAAVQLLKLATDVERLARGEPTEHTSLTGKDGGPVAIVTKWNGGSKAGGEDGES